jgi:hypothetical protein
VAFIKPIAAETFWSQSAPASFTFSLIWKNSNVVPLPKVNSTIENSDFHPIPIFCILATALCLRKWLMTSPVINLFFRFSLIFDLVIAQWLLLWVFLMIFAWISSWTSQRILYYNDLSKLHHRYSFDTLVVALVSSFFFGIKWSSAVMTIFRHWLH